MIHRIEKYQLQIENCQLSAPTRRANSQFSILNSQFAISPRRRAGFTLIELMVTVVLSLIILGMFAALYRWTTDTYTQQRGNRRNDQRSRMLSIIIRADLQLRSFKQVVPFVPGQNTGTALNYDSSQRLGYFAISENNPDIQTDDVIAFTTRIPADSRQRPYIGRAFILSQPITMTGNRNQPEFDDGDPNINRSGQSSTAEVVYFVRNGNLIRRVLLIREPYDLDGGMAQPANLTGRYNEDTNLDGTLDPAEDRNGNTTWERIFWNDFDYAAWYNFMTNQTRFHNADITTGSLPNTNPPTATTAQNFPAELGIPYLRFGHSLSSISLGTPSKYNLLPREFDSTGKFFGRFLIEETASPNFFYPSDPALANDPHILDTAVDPDGDTTNGQMTLNNNGLITRFAASTARRREDVIMTNVHEFDIKVWDDPLGRFVDLGHEISPNGFYHHSKNLRSAAVRANAMPRDWRQWQWNRFDTWHPYHGGTTPTPPVTNAMAGALELPPYKASKPTEMTAAAGLGVTTGTNPERPLRAIQITIRFYDPPTKKMRQLTIIQDL